MPRTDTHTEPETPVPNDDDLLTRKDAAALINYSVSTIRRWDRVGILPLLRTPSGRVRYRRGDVLAAAEARPVEDVA
jgi:predicted site-specific integrase-resolvase